MEVLDAIFSRKSVGKVKTDPVDQATVEKLLAAAVAAPNHRRTEPWKFFVLSGEGRRPLGRTMAAIAAEEMTDPQSAENEKRLAKIAEKPFRAPLVIAVAVSPVSQPNVFWQEELAAVSAAVENMLLAATGLGLGAIWRTGRAAYHAKMKKLFGLQGEEQIVGFVYVGYPEIPPQAKEKPTFQEKTVWVDHDQPYA